MRYAKLLLVGIGVLLFTGCVAEKRLTLCQADNETLTLKVADQKAKMNRQEEATKDILASALDEAKKVKEQLKQAKAALVKIRKELSVAKESHKKTRAVIDKAHLRALGKIAKTEKKAMAYESRVGTLKKELAEANRKLKDAEARAAKLTEENRDLKAKTADLPK